MKYTIKKLPKSQIEMLFEVPSEDLGKFYKEAVLELGQEIKIEGFRPGHIPEKIIEQKVGKMAILEEAAEHAIQENYQKVVLENNLTPISQPQVEILKLAPANPLEFKVLVFVLPEIKLPDYKKIAAGVKRKEISVAEKEVEGTGRIRAEILDKISEASVCEIPEVLIESEKKRTPGLPQEQAKKRVMNSLVLKELGTKENINVSEEEIKEEIDRFSKQYPDIKTAKNQFDAERLKEYIKDAIVNEKTFQLLENLIKK